jgi:ABC-2 type transport system permease protein
VPPIVQLLLFGYAVNMDVDHSVIGWMDLDRSTESRDLRERFTGSGHFTIVRELASNADAQYALDRGTIQAAVRLLPGFAQDLQRQRQTAVEIIVDGANSNTAQILAAQAQSIVAAYSAEQMRVQQRRRLVGRPEATRLGVPDVRAESRVWFNPELRSRNYFVPGVAANIVILITLMLTAMALVREKEIGTMEQLMVTPIRPAELILGKCLPFAVIGLVQVTLMTTVALLVFHVPFRGNVLMLYGCSLLAVLNSLGVGLLISSVSQTQQQAMLSSFMFFQPAFTLSGFSFPIRNMPEVVQWITYLNPVRYFMEIMRAVFLKGAGPETLWPQMTALAAIGVTVLTLAALRFRKRLDS